MNTLIILNEAPCGNEKTYNALRLAMTLQKEQVEVALQIFLMADADSCTLPNQNTAQGFYSIERMLKSVISRGAQVKARGTCSEARGLRALALIEGIDISTMSQLAQWTVEADKVVVF